MEDLLSILEAAGLNRQGLHVELTESMMMPDSPATAKVVSALSAAGIEMHLDDFGTGFSSLSYLNRLPVAAIKIDRSFLRPHEATVGDVSTLKALIDMAHAHRLRVIAEGIETEAQLKLLQGLGCDQGQGFHFARPMDPELVEIALRAAPQPVQV